MTPQNEFEAARRRAAHPRAGRRRAAPLLTAAAALTLWGCGAPTSPTTDVAPVPVVSPTATAVGEATGAPVTRVIGTSGGVVTSEDGAVRVTVPEGALAGDTTVGVQPIVNHAHGAVGRAVRLTPEGVRFLKPVTVSLAYDAADVVGSTAGLLNIAYQTKAGFWAVPREQTRDLATRTVTVRTDHFSDWSIVQGARLLPGEATVRTGGTLALRLRVCEFAPAEDELLLGIVAPCEESRYLNLRARDWAVNGVPGGDAGVGSVTASDGGTATYTAPAARPRSNPVAVSTVFKPLHGAGVETLVSNVKVTDAEEWTGTVTLTVEGQAVRPHTDGATGEDTRTYRHVEVFKVGDVVERVGPSTLLEFEADAEVRETHRRRYFKETWGAACTINQPSILRFVRDETTTTTLEGKDRATVRKRLHIGADGRYSLFLDSVRPLARGEQVRSERYVDVCRPQNSFDRTTRTALEERAFGTAGVEGQIDPANPDVLSGSVTRELPNATKLLPVRQTVTWNLRRVP